MLLLQPRAQNPTGASTSPARAQALAELLAATDTIVVEDDHSGDVASGDPVSLGRWLGSQTVHIRSYAKSHGPDLRLAAIGGAAPVVDAVAARRLIGPGWSSRILQALLVELLDDPAVVDHVAEARRTYAHRRAAFASALAGHGIELGGSDGINSWVPVADERSALVTLAAQGIGAAPGTPFLVRPDDDHLRITIGLVADEADAIERLAEAVAEAAAPASARTNRR